MEGSRLTRTGHWPALDGLRGVAAIAVVVFHCAVWVLPVRLVPHAFLAVDFFFILSGLVVDHAYRSRLKGGMTRGDFARARIIRLYPMLVLGTLLGFPVALAVYGVSIWTGLPFAVLGLPIPYGWADTPFTINVPAWSLFFELIASTFYVVIGYKLRWPVIAGIAALSVAVLMLGAREQHSLNLGAHYAGLFYGLPRAMLGFSIGMLLARLISKVTLPRVPFEALALIVVASFLVPTLKRGDNYYALLSLFVLYPAVMCLGCFSNPSTQTGRLVEWLGAISYPLYIVHMPVKKLGDYLALNRFGFLGIAAVLLSSVALAEVLLRYYDEPIRKWLKTQAHNSGLSGAESRPSRL
ncbi:acyltransferase family protein [Sphingomonas aerophila]|uniref:Peptidoglycan/LPS O-acetylase OafA/YrhL n=1 Tax=Sphingomonas aerophila TaxID=1344948 RepID=A0A7W9EU46_9SPHN|nr:acyltransferase [Sphingomonas aerophila]MBB5714770.1 peptidoglycan/LPS O-acetylase OafA/YrhL [Sphingomonas aerophila]